MEFYGAYIVTMPAKKQPALKCQCFEMNCSQKHDWCSQHFMDFSNSIWNPICHGREQAITKKASEIGRRSHYVTLPWQQNFWVSTRPRQSLRSHLSSLLRRNRLIGERTTTILSTHFELFEYSNKEFKM